MTRLVLILPPSIVPLSHAILSMHALHLQSLTAAGLLDPERPTHFPQCKRRTEPPLLKASVERSGLSISADTTIRPYRLLLTVRTCRSAPALADKRWLEGHVLEEEPEHVPLHVFPAPVLFTKFTGLVCDLPR